MNPYPAFKADIPPLMPPTRSSMLDFCPIFGNLVLYRLQAPCQLMVVSMTLRSWTPLLQDHQIILTSRERHGLTSYFVCSVSIHGATVSGYSFLGQVHSGLPQGDHSACSDQSACNNRMESPSQVPPLILELWGLPTVDLLTSVHNTQLLQFMSRIPESKVLTGEALS